MDTIARARELAQKLTTIADELEAMTPELLRLDHAVDRRVDELEPEWDVESDAYAQANRELGMAEIYPQVRRIAGWAGGDWT